MRSRAWLLAGALMISVCTALAQRSPFNGLEVLPADSTGHYRILIGGHFHGESSNRSGYPASTLLANLDTINGLGAHLFLSTGDLYMDAKADSARYAKALFSKLKVPFFNAPGNHDGSKGSGLVCDIRMIGRVGYADDQQVDLDGSYLEKDFRFHVPPSVGPSYASLHFLLNLEQSDGSVEASQLKRLRETAEDLQRFRELSEASHDSWRTEWKVFIISHRPIWAEGDPQYSNLFKDNTRSLTGTNFQKEVYPILQDIAKHAQVFWISGSLGGQAPSSIFFQQHAHNITYIQCAIRDEPRDALLIADVHPDTLKWSALSLTGQQLEAPETYDAAWWGKRVGKEEPFNWRLLPYLIKKTLTRAEFWWGAAFGVLLLLIARRLYRR